jgi:hypothetical protein
MTRARIARAARVVALLGMLGGLAGTAHADRADQLFRRGKKLLAEKRYAEACAAFEGSDRIDPGIGAKLNVARCYQEWGRLATAWRWFNDAEQMAQTAKDDRATKIHELMAELDTSVPRLIVKLAPGIDAAGIQVKLDHTPLTVAELGVERRVDPGPHQIDYVVSGAKLSKTVPVERGGTSEVVLDAPGKRGSPTSRPVTATTTAQVTVVDGDLGNTRRVVGLGIASAGVVAVGIAGFVTLGARGDYNDALTEHCRGASDMCNAAGLAATRDARSTANTATIVTIAGGVAVVGGLTLYLLAPRASREAHALYVAPSIGAHGGTVVVGGAF